MRFTKIIELENLLVVRNKEKGKCVIANKNFKKGDVILQDNFIYEKTKNLSLSKWFNYVWEEDDYTYFILGLGSFCNHSSHHYNCDVEWNNKKLIVAYIANRNIEKGEELLIFYGDNVNFKENKPVKLPNN